MRNLFQRGATATNPVAVPSKSSADAPIAERPAPFGRSAAAWWLVTVVMCIALGRYAVVLNEHYYQHGGPFYDSMSYHDQLYQVMHSVQLRGLFKTLSDCVTQGTVFMPQFIAALASYWVQPSRAVGIWIQTGELILFASSLFYYLCRIRRMSPPLAALLLVPIASERCLYLLFGGLADFRMDLSLALMFCTTLIWYLTASTTNSLRHYLVFGLCGGITCLFRATAPVYLFVALAPLCVADIMLKPDRKQRSLGTAAAVLTTSLVAGWFFVVNFAGLRYYYTVWNHDALATLPWDQSWLHARFVWEQIGLPTALFLAAFQALMLIEWLRRSVGRGFFNALTAALAGIDWRLLWGAAAPAAFLIVKGAGLNAFVSMPSAIGMGLFLMLPIAGVYAVSAKKWYYVLLAPAAAYCLVTAATEGWQQHTAPATDPMAAQKSVIESMVADAQQRQLPAPTFGVCHLYYMNSFSLMNVLKFDLPSHFDSEGKIGYRGVTLQRRAFERNNNAEWLQVPGDTDAAKVDTLLGEAEKHFDYLVIPDEGTAKHMQKYQWYHPTNFHLTEIRQRLLESGNWQQVSPVICSRPEEVVAVYRNVGRTVAAAARPAAR